MEPPVVVSRRPMRLPPFTVNQMTPFSSMTKVCGSPPEGGLELRHLPRGRIEAPDRAIAVARVPDDALPVDEKTVRLGAPRQVPLREHLRRRVEARDPVAVHHRDVDVAVGAGRGIAREPRGGHGPLGDLPRGRGTRPRSQTVVRLPGPHDAVQEQEHDDGVTDGAHGPGLSPPRRWPSGPRPLADFRIVGEHRPDVNHANVAYAPRVYAAVYRRDAGAPTAAGLSRGGSLRDLRPIARAGPRSPGLA